MKAINIIWDIDEEDVDEVDLPTEIDIPDGMDEDEVSDYLSSITGFCHKGYTLVEGTTLEEEGYKEYEVEITSYEDEREAAKGIANARLEFWQFYEYRDARYPLVFVKLPLTHKQILALLGVMDEWYGNTNQETTIWALEFQLLTRWALNNLSFFETRAKALSEKLCDSYVLVNPKYLDMDDKSTMSELEEILGKVNMAVWLHYHRIDWSDIDLEEAEEAGRDFVQEREAKTYGKHE